MSLPEFDLSKIALYLEGLEESIIHKLLDRAQFARNPFVYQEGSSNFESYESLSLFEVRLLKQEEIDFQFGRFVVPEERPFNDLSLSPRRKILFSHKFPMSNFQAISQNKAIKQAYINLIPQLCPYQDDGHYGSSVEHDVYALQAIARRIHFGGLYVSESKYLQKPDQFDKLIQMKDKIGLMQLLTRKEVEDMILVRIKEKVESIQELTNEKIRVRVKSDIVVNFYRDVIIPLTKEAEIAYFLEREE